MAGDEREDREIERRFPSDVAFTPAVKAVQQRFGSRRGYARMEEREGWQTKVSDDLAAFLAQQDSFYFASANAAGQPYVQHRGGPAGFLKVLNRKTLGIADFSGNKQYITAGNLSENDRVHIFLIDHAHRRRVKIWGRAWIVEDDPELMDRLTDPGYAARPERAILITVQAWDVNCPQHITRRYSTAQIAPAFEKLENRILDLEAEVEALRKKLSAAGLGDDVAPA